LVKKQEQKSTWRLPQKTTDRFTQNQKECDNIAGSVVQKRQVGSRSANISF